MTFLREKNRLSFWRMWLYAGDMIRLKNVAKRPFELLSVNHIPQVDNRLLVVDHVVVL